MINMVQHANIIRTHAHADINTRTKGRIQRTDSKANTRTQRGRRTTSEYKPYRVNSQFNYKIIIYASKFIHNEQAEATAAKLVDFAQG